MGDPKIAELVESTITADKAVVAYLVRLHAIIYDGSIDAPAVRAVVLDSLKQTADRVQESIARRTEFTDTDGTHGTGSYKW